MLSGSPIQIQRQESYGARAGHGKIFLIPPRFLNDDEKQTPHLFVCVGPASENKWAIPPYVPEMNGLLSADEYSAIMRDFAAVYRDNLISQECLYFQYFCCICTLGLSCVYPCYHKQSFKSKLQAILDRHKATWSNPAASQAITLVSHSVANAIPLSEVGADSIPLDQNGEPHIENIGQKNILSPDTLRDLQILNHLRFSGSLTTVNGIPVQAHIRRPIIVNRLELERQLAIINAVDQLFVEWPPLGFSLKIKMQDPLLFIKWPQRIYSQPT